jgi:hypothetical protein
MNDALKVKPDMKVLYIDTERNLKLIPQHNNVKYVYIASMNKLYDFIVKENTLENKYELIILDSLGASVLGEFATMDMNTRGQALLKAEGLTYKLKTYSNTTGAFILILNQPESEFGRPKDYRLEPFGDKHIYFVKEVWESTRAISSNADLTICNIRAYRSRVFGRDKLLYQLKIFGSPNDIKCEIIRKWQ